MDEHNGRWFRPSLPTGWATKRGPWINASPFTATARPLRIEVPPFEADEVRYAAATEPLFRHTLYCENSRGCDVRPSRVDAPRTCASRRIESGDARCAVGAEESRADVNEFAHDSRASTCRE